MTGFELSRGKPKELSETAADRIKLILLTGVEPREKIQALRAIALTPWPQDEKGALILGALGDADAEVRREAALQLRTLGLAADLSESLATLAQSSPRQKLISLQKLAAARMSKNERSIALASLLSCLRHEQEAPVVAAILEGLVPFADLLAAGGESTAALARQLVKGLADRFLELGPPTQRLLSALANTGSEAVADSLWREIEGITDRPIRTYFQTALASMPLEDSLRRKLAEAIARDLASASVEDLALRRLAEAFGGLGDAAVQALLDVYPSVAPESRGAILAILDSTASRDDVADAARNEVGALLLSVLRESGRSLRVLVVNSRVCSHARLSPALRRKFCLAFLENVPAFRADGVLDSAVVALRRLGMGMAEALMERIRKSPHAEEREAAARALEELGGDPEETIRFFRSLEGGDCLPAGQVLRAVGRLGAGSAHAGEIAQKYLHRLSSSSHPFDILAALAWLGASPACPPAAASDIVLKHVEVLQGDLPELVVKETKTEEGTRWDIGAQTAVYTDVLPEAIAGIARIVCAGRLPAGIRDRAVRGLLGKYRDLLDYREVWAPGNMVELARALGEISRQPSTPPEMRIEILRALLQNLRNLSTARIASEALAACDDRSKPMRELAEECVAKLFDLLRRRDYREREDRRVLLASVGRTALNPSLGRASRLRAAEALLEEASRDFAEGKEVLARLASSRGLPKELRERIARAK